MYYTIEFTTIWEIYGTYSSNIICSKQAAHPAQEAGVEFVYIRTSIQAVLRF